MEANDLLSSQQSQLNELLIKNKELFVTKENLKLGLTNLVEHLYRKACVLEFRYRKSTQNLDINRLPSFEPVSNPEFGRFLLETKIMGLQMGICSFSLFFQMCISPESTKYTAFNTCFRF
jgi:hypothetical protein